MHNLRAEKLLTQKPTDKDLDRYGLKAPAVKVTISETKPDKKPPEQSSTLLLGKETEDKSSIFAKRGNQDMVFMLKKGILDALQGDLRDPAVLKFDINKVKTVKIAGWQDVVGSPFVLELERRTSQDWAVKNPNFVLNSAQVETFVSGLSSLRAERFIGVKSGAKPEYKLDLKDGAMDIIITVEGEKDPLMLTVGSPADPDGYYTKTNKLPNEIFVVAKASFDKAKTKPAYFKKEQ